MSTESRELQLSWLLAFERAGVASTFERNGKSWRREFEFEPSVEGIVSNSLVEVDDRDLTETVELVGFLPAAVPTRSRYCSRNSFAATGFVLMTVSMITSIRIPSLLSQAFCCAS